MRDILVLDGGMGKQLERAGAPFRQPEWSALALIEDPDAVRDAHAAFIDAGADIITVNSYAVVPFHLGDERFAERGRELADLAGRLAREAADAAGRPVLVAGSIPPLFGSYEPEKFEPERAPGLLDVLIEAQDPYVDVWIGETVGSIAEARAIVEALERFGNDPLDKEVWMSFTVPDVLDGDSVPIRSGESVTHAAAAVANDVQAILFNCSPPEAISLALNELQRALEPNVSGLGTGGYANAFVPKVDGYAANEVVLGRREDLTPDEYRAIIAEWVDGGASIVGGCCHMFPEHIHELAALRDGVEHTH